MACCMRMRPILRPALLLTLVAATPPEQPKQPPVPSPGEIVAAAPASDWRDIAPDDLLVMTLAPDAKGKARTVIIQLMPPPFGMGWVSNIRTLAKAHWYDGLSINRVQDNYVVQWGDADSDDDKKAKTLPAGLMTVPERAYLTTPDEIAATESTVGHAATAADALAAIADIVKQKPERDRVGALAFAHSRTEKFPNGWHDRDSYAEWVEIHSGWPLAGQGETMWPVHCYATVGVGRGLSPDTGTGAELYTVIGHAPRHLDRNIAVVGRVIQGIEYLSSLPRGTGQLGFYENPGERTPIISIRLASELPKAEQPHLQYLATDSESFARYADARTNRADPFFIVPAGGADICNIPVPIRRKP